MGQLSLPTLSGSQPYAQTSPGPEVTELLLPDKHQYREQEEPDRCGCGLGGWGDCLQFCFDCTCCLAE